MQAHTFRRLPRLCPANHPDRLAQQLEQVRRCDEQEQERRIRRELREFTDNFGIGIGQ